MDSSREEKKYKDKNKAKKKEKLSRRSSRASISRQGWTLWISYKSHDSVPVVCSHALIIILGIFLTIISIDF